MPVCPPRHRLAGVADRVAAERRYEQGRGSASARGYDRTWQRVRLQVLRGEPLCRFCAAAGLVVAASEVDHVVPIAQAPQRRLDRSNLRPLCKPCHSARTASDQAQAGLPGHV